MKHCTRAAAVMGVAGVVSVLAVGPAFAVTDNGTYYCPEIWQTSASAQGYGSGNMWIKAPGGSSLHYEGYSSGMRYENHSVGSEGRWAVEASLTLNDPGTFAYCNG